MTPLLAVAALVSAAVHFKLLVYDGYIELFVVGPAFVLNVVAGVVIAGLLVFWRHLAAAPAGHGLRRGHAGRIRRLDDRWSVRRP